MDKRVLIGLIILVIGLVIVSGCVKDGVEPVPQPPVTNHTQPGDDIIYTPEDKFIFHDPLNVHGEWSPVYTGLWEVPGGFREYGTLWVPEVLDTGWVIVNDKGQVPCSGGGASDKPKLVKGSEPGTIYFVNGLRIEAI